MGRPRSVDREHLLDTAETLVSASGAAGLSFGGIAAAAGVPKASVQSAFGTKEALIEAMLERWIGREQERFARAAGPDPDPRARIQAHLRTLCEEPADESSRVATLLAAMAGSGEQIASAARWYAARVGDLSARTPEARRLRIAFLAAEGAYYIRHLVGFDLSDAVWREIFADLERMADDPGIDRPA
ncbi:TetR/AcrR family transcriptional regulator [Methylobacterium sp. NEAU 140]|uniref:TetR/AcrR family transcriptional regulator n=1 Tax=Methylobacterium sp. NEAU 140 TaxID=3064945 RepID=UPI002736F7AB|nr:TetR/AcrR family transcriptional regulator [Methylobacterium sp. NEAU 140]MDP4022239.1 TetR/AcrR family transcriptional regulator [Methylobacterium sp. NEAU 140]